MRAPDRSQRAAGETNTREGTGAAGQIETRGRRLPAERRQAPGSQLVPWSGSLAGNKAIRVIAIKPCCSSHEGC